jgi:hypothetical protein
MTHIMDARDFEHVASMINENIAGLFHMFSPIKGHLLLSWAEALANLTSVL